MNNLKTLRSESVFEPDSDISVKQEKTFVQFECMIMTNQLITK